MQNPFPCRTARLVPSPEGYDSMTSTVTFQATRAVIATSVEDAKQKWKPRPGGVFHGLSAKAFSMASTKSPSSGAVRLLKAVTVRASRVMRYL